MNFEEPYRRLNYYYSRLLQKASLFTGSSLGKPTSVIVVLTNRCNARCIHCHSWKLPFPEKELSTEEWKEVFYQLRQWLGPAFMMLTGGEVLLRKDAIELLQYLNELGFWTEFLTNGSLMDAEKAEKIVLSGVKRIHISLDGSKPEIHDKVRGRKGFFEKTTLALKRLSAEKERFKKQMDIWCKSVIMRLNLDDMPNIPPLAQQLGVDVMFQALEPIYYSNQVGNPNWHKNNPLWIDDLNKLSDTICDLKELKLQGFPIINSNENLDLIQNFFSDPESQFHKIESHQYDKQKKECTSWNGALQIMPDGGMKMCHRMEPFAYVKDGPVKKAWSHRKKCWKENCGFIV